MSDFHKGQSLSGRILLCMDQIQACIDHTVQGKHTVEQAYETIDKCLGNLRAYMGDYYRHRLLNALDLKATTDAARAELAAIEAKRPRHSRGT